MISARILALLSLKAAAVADDSGDATRARQLRAAARAMLNGEG